MNLKELTKAHALKGRGIPLEEAKLLVKKLDYYTQEDWTIDEMMRLRDLMEFNTPTWSGDVPIKRNTELCRRKVNDTISSVTNDLPAQGTRKKKGRDRGA